jgi:hypothetical protein
VYPQITNRRRYMVNYLVLVKFHPQNSFRNGGNRDLNGKLTAAVIN